MSLISTQEACEYLRCERRKLKRIAQDNGLHRTRVGRFVYYQSEELDKFLTKNTY